MTDSTRSPLAAIDAIRIRLFGPMECRVAGNPVNVGPRKQRAVLAILALEPGQVVSVDRLIEGIWGEDAPDAARNTIQVYVGGLRRALGPAGRLIRTVEPGYGLAIEPDAVDVVRFERLLDAPPTGRRHPGTVREALALWTAAPLADLRELPLADAVVARLGELRTQAIEDRIDHDLEGGSTAGLIVEIEDHLREEPYRERLWRQLMLAHYRSGRQAEALATFQRARQLLDEELGLEPGPALVALERAVLLQDPALDTPAPRRIVLPALATATIGRDEAIARVGRLVTSERLTSLVGPGGIGKTRVAIAAAHDVAATFEDGAIFVDLSTLDGERAFVPEIARAVGAASAADDVAAVAEALGERRVLLVLDNTEQFDSAPEAIARLLSLTPSVHVLVTTRISLRIAAEHVVTLGPLASDDAGDLAADAIRRATGGEISPLVALDLAAELDGLPLGIELAAAACRTMPATEVLAMIRQRIALPDGPRDLPARQRTVRAVVEWSFERVSPTDRQVLEAMTVFQAPVDADAVAIVSDLDGPTARAALGRLIETSLVLRDGSDHRLLQPIRSVLTDPLDPATLGRLRDRHAAWITRECVEGAPRLYEGDGLAARARLVGLLPDMRAAFAHRVAQSEWEAAARIIVDIGQVWFHAGRLHEARDLLGQVVDEELEPRTRAEALSLRGIYAKMVGDLDAAEAWISAGLDGLTSLAPDSVALVNALCHLADVRVGQGRTDEALTLADDAVAAARRLADPGTTSMALDLAGYVARAAGDDRRAIEIARAAVDAARGQDRFLLADALAGLAASLGPADPTAASLAWEALILADELGQPTQQSRVAVFVADVLAPIDPADLAARLARALATYLSIGSIPSTVDAGLALARVGASTDPAAATALVAALCRRGGDAAEADAAGLIGDLRSRLGPGAFARASGSGATLDDDRLSRLGRDLANAVAAPKAVGAT